MPSNLIGKLHKMTPMSQKLREATSKLVGCRRNDRDAKMTKIANPLETIATMKTHTSRIMNIMVRKSNRLSTQPLLLPKNVFDNTALVVVFSDLLFPLSLKSNTLSFVAVV